jgi:DNA-binding transcriptional MocR family regulator
MQFAALDRSRPLSDQIAQQVIAQVEADRLREGTRLPSVRALAERLGVNRNTIAQVYKELAQKGYLVARFGAGSTVRKPEIPGRKPEPAARIDAGGLNGARVASPRAELPAAPEPLSAREWEQRFAAAVGGFPAQAAPLPNHGPTHGSGRAGHPAGRTPGRGGHASGRGATNGGRAERGAHEEGGAINLSALQPYTGLFPLEQFRLCLNTVLRRQGRALLGYAAPAGYLPLRERIAARLKAQGIAVEAAQVLITSGSQQGIDLLARGFLDPGDGVVVEAPTYSIALKILQVNRARLIPYAVTADGIRLDGLERALGRAGDGGAGRAGDGGGPKLFYAVPNFQNPTTHSYSEAEKRALLAWVYRTGALLIEDASDAELHADFARRPALAALDGTALGGPGRVLYLNTFSKTMAPAVRVGYLAGPAPAIRKLTELKEMTDLSHSLILQAAAAEFMERGLFDAHIEAVRGFYRERMAAAGELLERELPGETPFTRPGGGLCVWVDLPHPVDADGVQRELAQQGVLVSPGGLYQPDGAAHLPGGARNGLRLCVAGEPAERLAEGIRILGAHLKRVLRRPPPRPILTEYQSIH